VHHGETSQRAGCLWQGTGGLADGAGLGGLNRDRLAQLLLDEVDQVEHEGCEFGAGQERCASRRLSPGGEGVGCTEAQTAVVLPREKKTATTSTAGTRKKSLLPANGCVR
jgi:hypothetical protein